MDSSTCPPGDSDATADQSSFNSAALNARDSHMRELASLKEPLSGDCQGSVLAIVRFADDDSARSCDGKRWRDVRIRMSYERLMSLGSSKIRDMFSPRAQARFRRQPGLEPLPHGIEYVLDFTPPAEGPELADLTAALWLPKMVKLWFLAGHYVPDSVLARGSDGLQRRPLAEKTVGAILTLGHDDVCKYHSCLTDMSQWQINDKVPGIIDECTDFPSHIPAFRKVEDYCPIRHRVAIVRVLRAINGESPLLNSAVRMWTVAQVAICLEVPQVVVDPVTQWLIAPPNTKFIEICPEKAFQLAYSLRIPSVLIASFKILVNELAIDYAASEPSPHRPAMTWAQRRRDDYGDFPCDPVDYASRAFAERMNGKLKTLQSDDVFDRLPPRNPEWNKLRYLGTLINALDPCPLQEAYQLLTAGLLAVFHEHVRESLDPQEDNLARRLAELLDAQRKHYISKGDRQPLLSLYQNLNDSQKVLTPIFWNEMNYMGKCSDFSARRYRDKQLQQLASDFYFHLQDALRSNTITPDLSTAPPEVEYEGHLKFDMERFHGALRNALNRFCPTILNRDADSGVPFFLSDHLLLTLDETELNYLPIWADGLDDGSGGVFQDAIPPADMGPSEPGPGYHTGRTVGGGGPETDAEADADNTLAAPGSPSSSDLGMGMLALDDDEGEATVACSMDAHRSATATATATTYGQAAHTGTTASSVAYNEARFAVPAAHQAQGQAIARYVEEEEEEGEEEEEEEGDDGEHVEVDLDLDLDSDSDSDSDGGETDGLSDDGSSTLDGFEEVEGEG
ncbi:hypothetical protein VTK56DRAFT_3973 [Thermocarpiscus australiensis]